MNSLNQVIIEGNVVRQPEKKTCKNGSFMCRVPIAVNRYYKDKNGEYVDDVSFFDISTFGSLSETCEKWCLKGRGIRVVGRLKQNVSSDEEGKKHSRIDIIAEHVEFKPVMKKNGDHETETAAADEAPKTSASKKEKLAMLAEVAAATQKEQEAEEEIAF